MWQREYWLYPDTSREDLNTHLFDQVWNMLQIMQETVEGNIWNKEDKDLIRGLNAILVIHFRVNKLVDKFLKDCDHDLNK